MRSRCSKFEFVLLKKEKFLNVGYNKLHSYNDTYILYYIIALWWWWWMVEPRAVPVYTTDPSIQGLMAMMYCRDVEKFPSVKTSY